MANYEKLFKGIIGASVGLGAVVGTNMLSKLFKIDRLSNEVNTINNSNNNLGGNTEMFEAEFVDDDFVSDQEVEGRI